ncbi:MAG: carbohydrate kinase family protein, partial [Nitrososphaerales archaeon]
FDAGLLLVHSRRIKLIMDGNGAEKAPPKDAGLRRALRSVDLFLPNLREARHLTGQSDPHAAVTALAALCRLPVLKAGGEGAYAAVDGKIIRAPAIPVTPVDTTGAGDCFNAGFIKAWLEGRPVEECLRWGNAVGGLSTTVAGGAGRVITPEDVAPYL